MKHIFIGILALLIGFADACFAQQSFFVWKEGKQTVCIADSITFSESNPNYIYLWLDNEQTLVKVDSISQRQPNLNIPFNTNGYEYVDLGLPSGMYWATANVGATSPSENGLNFRWASCTPNITTYDISYPYEDDSENEAYKYNVIEFSELYDGYKELHLCDDAAHALMGGSWRMPSESETQELLDNCTWSVDTIDNTRVYIGVGPNGNKIILPKTFQFWNGQHYDVLNADYWTKSVCGSETAMVLAFNDSTGEGFFIGQRRSEQIPIRAVCNPNEVLSKTAYTLSVKNNVAENGIIVGAGVYDANLFIPVKVVAKEGYEFLGFSNEKTNVTSTKIRLYHDVELAAVFMATGECEDGKFNGFGHVDLGLPSGNLWATCNYGASKIEEEGEFFTWGEVATKEDYSCGGYQPYNTKLKDSTDAAHVNMGEQWKTPAYKDWHELLDNTYHIPTAINGVSGYRLVSKSNGKWIFLPACHNRVDVSISERADYEYLSSDMNGPYLFCLAEYTNKELAFTGKNKLGVSSTLDRCNGYPLRAVYIIPSPIEYVDLIVESTEGGKATAGGRFAKDTTISISAVAEDGYYFDKWSDGVFDVTRKIKLSSDSTITAYFAKTCEKVDGALPKRFSVSDTTSVQISMGNLQYLASANTWRFAPEQYDIVRKDNKYISATDSAWIDLFGWGTSGYRDYFPYLSRSVESVYININSIAGTDYDWGLYNAISNGGNQKGIWRTMTKAEWKYLTLERPNAEALCFRTKIVGNGISTVGFVILPDDFETPEGLVMDNELTIDEWYKLESVGAAFFPCAGYRMNTTYNLDSHGHYWTTDRRSYADFYYYGNGKLSNLISFPNTFPYEGYSVRLVKD
ncbi:MAG: hypothetical protein KBT32_10895 [Bacteroidales bacterium]|nr:hypothetical protein [Candidatus Physcocola equi]